MSEWVSEYLMSARNLELTPNPQNFILIRATIHCYIKFLLTALLLQYNHESIFQAAVSNV